jgi:hypothetical protein
MNVPFPFILIFGIVAVLVFIEVLVLIIPLRISLSFHSSKAETRGNFQVSWSIFGLEVLVPGKDPQLSVLVGGKRLITRPLSSFTGHEKPHTGGPGPGQVPGIMNSLLILVEPALDAVLDLVRHTRLDYIRGNVRIGLENPCATGMIYGLYRAVLPLLPGDRVSLTVVPEFCHEVCEIDIMTRFRVTYPILVVVNALKIVKHPDARKIMKSMRAKPGGAAT